MHALLNTTDRIVGRLVARVDTLDALGPALARPDCLLAVYERRPDPALAALDTLAFEAIDPIDMVMPVATLDGDVPVALGLAGYPGGVTEALAADVVRLARLHAAIRTVTRVRIRLEWIVTDACKRFHADYVTTRLLVTYRGAGTQWIDAARPQAIGQVPGHAVAMLKGRLLAPEPRLLHRSPPVADVEGARLLLVIDPIDDA